MLLDVGAESKREMVIVGLTGNIGTGKSTVANFFKELGAYVIDWDELAREAVRPRSKAWKEITEYFGKAILNADQTINRQRLADIAFSNQKKLAKLNQIVHARVFEMDERATAEIRNRDPDALIIKDIPLLFEITQPIFIDKVIVVSASEQTQLGRLKEKGMSAQDARDRIKSQLPLEKKIEWADFVIDNDGSCEETKKQVEKIYSLLRKERKHRRQGPKRRLSRK